MRISFVATLPARNAHRNPNHCQAFFPFTLTRYHRRAELAAQWQLAAAVFELAGWTDGGGQV
jgi:hypothetical protein